MDAANRREAISKAIRRSAKPLTGAQLAGMFGVSRQIVVQDIALLRARGEQILATPEGYCPFPAPRGAVAVLPCRHVSFEDMRNELETIVSCGGRILDVIIEHPVYGEFRADLMLGTHAQVQDFLESLRKNDVVDLAGYLVLLMVEQGWDDFGDMLD